VQLCEQVLSLGEQVPPAAGEQLAGRGELDVAPVADGEVKDAPSLDHCVPGCGNIARTDQQAAQLRDRAVVLETQAAHAPQPVGDRLRATAVRLREHAGKHDRTRITTGKDAG
jgi:hypothetical protein